MLPDGYATLATVLRDAGYDTGLFGKWHLGSSPQFGPNHFGFNTSYGSLAGGVDPYNHFYKRGEHSVTWHRNSTLIEDKGHVTDLIVREAAQWIESRQQPWFSYVPFTAVHVPIKPTSQWLARYFHEDFDDDPARVLSYKKYAAYTSHMDWGIGQLLESLERTGQRDNTIVVFTSDNGGLEDLPLHGTDQYPGWQEEYPRLGTNKPYRGVKAQLYEGGVRSPTVISWRGQIEAGATMADPVQIADWMPTLCHLAGAARVGDWKLIRRQPPNNQPAGQPSGGPERELFHITEDPYETQEVSADYTDIVADLQAFIDDQRQLDDTSKRADVDSR